MRKKTRLRLLYPIIFSDICDVKNKFLKRMKLQTLYKALFITFIAISVIACNDTLDQVGFTIQPGQDRLAVGVDTLELDARTVQSDAVFSKTKYPVLGEYIDPVFGSIKSDYAGEFYFPESSSFKDGAVIDSVRLKISYTSIIGDSLAPMGLSVYEIVKPLPKNNDYTDINPKDYSNMASPMGTAIFSGKNSTWRTETYSSGRTTQTVTIYEINVPLPHELGEKFLTEYKKPGHGKLVNTNTFKEFFPGLYVTTTFGNSTILNVNLTSFHIHYHYLDKGGSSKNTDTIRTSQMRLNITPEVTQINYIENNNDQLLAESTEHTFVKSPAGVNTELHFPFSKLHAKLEAQALSLANLTIYALPEALENQTVKLSPPRHLLLVNKDSLEGFFENRKLPDNRTSFLSSAFDPNTYSYGFGNISAMVNHYNELNTNAFDLTYYLIPVDATISTDSYNQQSLTAIYNQMMPTAVMLDKRKGSLKLNMIFSSL